MAQWADRPRFWPCPALSSLCVALLAGRVAAHDHEDIITPNRKLLALFNEQADTPKRAALAATAASLWRSASSAASAACTLLASAASTPGRAAVAAIGSRKRSGAAVGSATPPATKRAGLEEPPCTFSPSARRLACRSG